MIKGVIFDLDGVVIDSPKIYFKVMSEFLKKQNLKVTNEEISNLISLSIKEEFNQLKEKYSLPISFENFLAQTIKKSMEISKTSLELKSGIKELLLDLQKNNFLIALASNNNREVVDFSLEKFELKKFFSVVICGEDVKRGKPDPEIYLKAALKLGLNPSECVAIEDTIIGAKSVKSAGIKCIAIPNGYIPKNNFFQADLIINGLFELDSKKISLM